MVDTQSTYLKPEAGRSAWTLVGVFTISIFLSASLLFSVQPMFAKLTLPLLGGASNVWNTAMVFFQGTLLAGYIYAHLLSKYAGLRTQVLIHALVTSAGLFFVPLTIASGWTPPAEGAQAFWLLGLFAVSVGVPFFAISANSPLLQRWFSRTDDKDADDPYFLYAASNAGSLLSLCLYPLVFEPMMRLQEQTGLWAKGYMLMIAAILIAGGAAYLRLKPEVDAKEAAQPKSSLRLGQRAYWVFLAFIPSSLMLGVTTHMTTNIASAPFLWILPLALFLLTFIIVFAKKPIVNFTQLSKLFPWVILVAIFAGVGIGNIFLSIGLSLICYFVITLLCHSRLVETRPDAAHLTEFYIWMSVGGVLGGVFNALAAPLVFNGTYEYFMVLFLASFVALEAGEESKDKARQMLYFAGFAIAAFALYQALNAAGVIMRYSVIAPALVLFLGLRLVRSQRKFLYADAAIAIAIITFLPAGLRDVTLQDRSFFGVLSVEAEATEYGPVHMFVHGDTVHNYQLQREDLRKIPLAYYSKGNTFDQGLSAVRARKQDLSVAMIGLGAGAMACYEQPADNWTYFEIDPAVVRMARDPRYFSYMQDCSYADDVRIGDARMTITQLAKASQDYIIVDAFSSDSIPSHLVTKEALALYRSRLKDDGLIFFHTSNRLMDISSVVVRLAEDAGLEARALIVTDFGDQPYAKFMSNSSGIMVGKAADIDGVLADKPQWTRFIPSDKVGVWSDDYSSIIGPIRSQLGKDAAQVIENP